ncbi:MAG TPA: VOC family protein [Bryobacteraceae bacterium]|jgi:catechol 2,3-dioxygenase-like lactoylglutathione lyase family enzyme
MAAQLPTRLHHNAYVTNDMEATRHFYEDLIGMPLVATWCESDELFGKERTYCHCFFGLADGSALAFFQFADAEDQEQFGPKMPPSPFHHIAVNVDAETQRRVEERFKAAGSREPSFYVLEHGYCRSIYATDPNGMILELTVDNSEAADGNEQRRRTAHADLKRWLAGDHRSNNAFRAATHQLA